MFSATNEFISRSLSISSLSTHSFLILKNSLRLYSQKSYVELSLKISQRTSARLLMRLLRRSYFAPVVAHGGRKSGLPATSGRGPIQLASGREATQGRAL